jgi:hypothetical protein
MGERFVWTLAVDSALTIDPDANQVTEAVPLPPSTRWIDELAGGRWYVNDALYQLDPATGAATAEVDGSFQAMAAGGSVGVNRVDARCPGSRVPA